MASCFWFCSRCAGLPLELDAEEYSLGENVVVHFVIDNTNEEPFNIDTRHHATPNVRRQVMAQH